MKLFAVVLVATIAAALVLASDGTAMAAGSPLKITMSAATAKAIAPAAAPIIARCPVLASGKPVTVTLTAAQIRSYVPALAKLPAKVGSGKSVMVTIKP